MADEPGGPELKIGVIGIDHGHIVGMVDGMLDAGAKVVAWATGVQTSNEQREAFQKGYPEAVEKSAREILEDETISLVLSAAINAHRADIAIAAMRHGKDVLVDKPGCVNLDQLSRVREVVTETNKIWSIYFAERVNAESSTLADQLIAQGRIGDVVQVIGQGPHSLSPSTRPSWFWDLNLAGGILADLGTHQIDQFLHFTGSREATILSAFVDNVATPERPGFQDFGEVLLEGDEGRGFARVDWLSPKGLPVLGDGRIMIMGTEGSIELRKFIDLAGRDGADHLFLANDKGVNYFDAGGAGKPFFVRLLKDIENRTYTAMSQEHAFLVTDLALRAQSIGEGEENW
ncbi:MAG: Gfo/Idh/MocA family oxidoreductase [Rhodobacteraceae bacterium]|nr:Gfo/Idh/MocA family oxidoreductase [Paracoccaceae bacterium]